MAYFDDEDMEVTMLVKNEAFVFKIPPRTAAKGYKAADWDLANPLWSGRLTLTSKCEQMTIRLQNPDGSLFAECPVNSSDRGPESVEPVLDSRRYFVLRIENGQGRAAFIGMGFNERNDAFDFSSALQDHKKNIQQAKDLKVEAARRAKEPKKDYSLKEGQTLEINIRPKKGSSRRRRRAADGDDDDDPFSLPPPPGSSSSVSTPLSAFGAAPTTTTTTSTSYSPAGSASVTPAPAMVPVQASSSPMDDLFSGFDSNFSSAPSASAAATMPALLGGLAPTPAPMSARVATTGYGAPPSGYGMPAPGYQPSVASGAGMMPQQPMMMQQQQPMMMQQQQPMMMQQQQPMMMQQQPPQPRHQSAMQPQSHQLFPF